MILAVDIGNTSIALGLLKHGRLLRKHSCLTNAFRPAVLAAFKRYKKQITAVVICSVVPNRTQKVKAVIKKFCTAPVKTLGRDLRVPIRNKTRKPKQVGMDRLVNALAAYRRLKTACVCVDFGTAITFDIVSGRGEYEGGVIAPGVELTLNALAEKTALLPRIQLKPVRSVVGKDTLSSIRSGCAVGLGALCDGVLRQIDRERGVRHKVVATGGYAAFMSRYSKRIRLIQPDLTLEGIYWAYDQP